MTASASVSAGVVESLYSINGFKMNGTVKFFDEEKDKIRSESFNEKDLGADLCDTDSLAKGEVVAAFIPCPVDGNHVLDGQSFWLGVVDRKTGERNFSCGLAECWFDYVQPVWQEDKQGNISNAEGLVYCENNFGWFDAGVSLKAKVVKDNNNESGLDGMNCAKSLRSVSALGEVYGDPMTRSKFKVNRVQGGATSTEIFD